MVRYSLGLEGVQDVVTTPVTTATLKIDSSVSAKHVGMAGFLGSQFKIITSITTELT